jgi:hypothetical protein
MAIKIIENENGTVTEKTSKQIKRERKLRKFQKTAGVAGFKAASVPLTEGTVAAVGNVPGAVIVVTKKVASAAVKAVQTGAAVKKR